jgi:hypothetical protein
MHWRRLDVPGTDRCELTHLTTGWRLDGIAEFGAASGVTRLRYIVEADDAWRTTRAAVQGTSRGLSLDVGVRRDGMGRWQVNGAPAPELGGLVDLDLGFTPATNLLPLRRLALPPGAAADTDAAWLDDSTWMFRRLSQRYVRRSASEYWYESPATGYAAVLTVSADGFVTDYPGLWVAD